MDLHAAPPGSPEAAAAEVRPSRFRPSCPQCGRPCPKFIRYANSSSLFPVRCDACGARFHLQYGFFAFLLIWGVFSPLYTVVILYLSLIFLPQILLIPAFIIAVFAAMLLLPFIGSPRLKSAPKP
jgi:hypothetical protein